MTRVHRGRDEYHEATDRRALTGAQAALDAVSRVEMACCALPVLQKELENLALVM